MNPVIIKTFGANPVTATLYQGNCLDIIPTISCFDIVITDPPYGISHHCDFKTRSRGNLAECNDYPNIIGDDVEFDPSFILDLNIPSVIWGANYFSNKLPKSSGWLVWDKERPDTLDQSTCELAWTNYVKGVRRFRYLWNGMMRAGEHGENYHATQKPIALITWIINLSWTPKGNIIDPYMGSGTTGVACLRTGRNFTGIELDPKYFDIACKRIENEAKQGTII